MSDLDIPDFLRRTVRGILPRTPGWKRMKAERPEGDRWLEAERWSVNVPGQWSINGGVGCGHRYVWVAAGRKWAYVRDSEGHIKVPVDDWNRVAKNGRKVE